MFRLFVGLCLLLFATACSVPQKKDYPVLPEIPAAIDVQAVWVTPVGERSEHAYRQLPTTTHEERIYITNASGDVSVLDMAEGNVVWRADVNETITSGPGLGKAMLAFSTNDGEIIALARSDGKQLWRSQLSTIALAKPVITRDKVYVQTIDEKLYALNVTDGQRIWVAGNEVPSLTLRGTTSPVIVDDKVITGFANGRLAAFDTSTGKMLWETSIAIPSGRTDLERMVDIDGFMALKNGLIFVTTFQGRVAAVSARDGAVTWNREMSSYTGVGISDSQIYLTDNEGFVWALDSNTGATLWRQGKLKDRDVSTPVVMSQGVVVADGGGYIHWLSQEDGGFLARRNFKQVHREAFVDWGDVDFDKLDYGVTVAPEVTDSRLLVRNNVGDLALFSVAEKRKDAPEPSWYDPFLNLFRLQ